MNVWVELHGYDRARALKLAGNINSNLRTVFPMARELKITTNEAADRIAEERPAQGARVQFGLSRGEGVDTARRPAVVASAEV